MPTFRISRNTAFEATSILRFLQITYGHAGTIAELFPNPQIKEQPDR